jgi:recombination protein RecA
MGLQARLMSQALRKLTAIISKSGSCLIFINQIRMKIGVVYGNPETTTGGNALKFYSSVRLEVRKSETITRSSEEDAIGNKVKVKVVKNKVAPPFKKVELEIIFGKGISAVASLLDAAIKYNLIEKSGSWFSYGTERIGQGRENVKEFLEKNPPIMAELEEKLRVIMFPGKIKKNKKADEKDSGDKKTEAKKPDESAAADSKPEEPKPAQKPAAEKKIPDGELLY